MVNVEVEKTSNESNANLVKRFTRKMQGSGVLQKVRDLRYSKRNESRYVRKKRAIKYLVKRREREELMKLGKIPQK